MLWTEFVEELAKLMGRARGMVGVACEVMVVVVGVASGWLTNLLGELILGGHLLSCGPRELGIVIGAVMSLPGSNVVFVNSTWLLRVSGLSLSTVVTSVLWSAPSSGPSLELTRSMANTTRVCTCVQHCQFPAQIE